jgi:hypothetical protein
MRTNGLSILSIKPRATVPSIRYSHTKGFLPALTPEQYKRKSQRFKRGVRHVTKVVHFPARSITILPT